MLTPKWFSGEVWVALLVMVVWVGLVYWMLAWARESLCGGSADTRLDLSSSLFHTTALLVAEPSFKLPTALTTQVRYFLITYIVYPTRLRDSVLVPLSFLIVTILIGLAAWIRLCDLL